jgi:hypothetical protein
MSFMLVDGLESRGLLEGEECYLLFGLFLSFF